MSKIYECITLENIDFETSCKIGVCGLIGVGKSTFCRKLVTDYEFKHIDVDDIRRKLLWDTTCEQTMSLHKKIIDELNQKVSLNGITLDRKLLNAVLFGRNSLENILAFNRILYPFVKNKIITEVSTDKRPYCIEWALLPYENYTDIVDCLITLDLNEKIWMSRLGTASKNDKTLSIEEIIRRKKVQIELFESMALYNNLKYSKEIKIKL